MKATAEGFPGPELAHSSRLFNADTILLLFIIATGALLRLVRFNEAPMTYDEFSALWRTGYTSFNDLITNGVKIPDMHPAAVQVFLNYWVSIFGTEALVIKLPFAACGITSIYLVYKLGSLWFNKTAGLFASMFMAFLQYPITYSLYARPYAMGLFFSLMMTLCWTKALFNNKRTHLYLAGFAMFAILGSLTHYFSMMLAAIAGISGLLFLREKNPIPYLIACLFIVIGLLPHLGITMYQFSKKGVGGWLGTPHPDFYLEYLRYIFHFSGWMYGLVIILFITGLLFFRNRDTTVKKFRLLAISWLVLPFIAGYLYSVLINPVLQYSVLFFVFPFLPLFIFSFWKDAGTALKYSITVIFFIVSISTLVFRREHYIHFYESGYKNNLLLIDASQKKYGRDNVRSYVFALEKNLNYYFNDTATVQEKGINILTDSSSVFTFEEQIKNVKEEYLSIGWSKPLNPAFLSVVEDHFPVLIEKHTGFLSEFYLFCNNRLAKCNNTTNDLVFETRICYASQAPGWDVLNDSSIFFNEYHDTCLLQTASDVYSPGFHKDLAEITSHANNYVLITLNIKELTNECNIQLISDISSKNEILDWRMVKSSEIKSNCRGWKKLHLGVNLADIDWYDRKAKLNVYAWNTNGSTFLIDNLIIKVLKGNPTFYSLFEDY